MQTAAVANNGWNGIRRRRPSSATVHVRDGVDVVSPPCLYTAHASKPNSFNVTMMNERFFFPAVSFFAFFAHLKETNRQNLEEF